MSRETKSGWCMDEVVALDIERPDLAIRYHGQCRSPETCPCPNHDLHRQPATR